MNIFSKINRKFNLILDNFDNIDRCKSIVNILSSCIAKNIKTYLATRSISKLTEKYDEYILNLANTLSINGEEIKLIIKKENIGNNDYISNININDDVYPTLDISEIKTFDVKKYVYDHKKIFPIDKPINDAEIDNMLKDIDKQIEKLNDMENDNS